MQHSRKSRGLGSKPCFEVSPGHIGIASLLESMFSKNWIQTCLKFSIAKEFSNVFNKIQISGTYAQIFCLHDLRALEEGSDLIL